MGEPKLVDYSDSSSEEESDIGHFGQNLDSSDQKEFGNIGSEISFNTERIKKVAVVQPTVQSNAESPYTGIDQNVGSEDLNTEHPTENDTHSDNLQPGNFSPIEITSFPIPSEIDDFEVIQVSSDSDSDATLLYDMPDDFGPDPYLEFDEVFSIKSCTSGNKNLTFFLTIIYVIQHP